MNTSNMFAFVLMPFAQEFSDVYRIGIKEPAAELGIRAERVDEQIYGENMLERIYRQIDSADIIVADMSGKNANVFYEVGYAHAREKLCLLLTKDAHDIPFDLKQRRHIVYGSSLQVLRTELRRDLEWAKSQVDNARKSRIRVSVNRIMPDLEKTDWIATAKLEFEIDLHNDSDVPSAEIEAIYFHTGPDWKTFQGDIVCSATKSDILPRFGQRHFLTPPIKRLHKSGWAQLKFRTEKMVAATYRGDILKDNYPIRGGSVLRLVTDKGQFDYDIPINVSADWMPF